MKTDVIKENRPAYCPGKTHQRRDRCGFERKKEENTHEDQGGVQALVFLHKVTVVHVEFMLELVVELDASVAGHLGEIWTERRVSFGRSILRTGNKKHGHQSLSRSGRGQWTHAFELTVPSPMTCYEELGGREARKVGVRATPATRRPDYISDGLRAALAS